MDGGAGASEYADKASAYFGAARRPFVDGLPHSPDGRLLEIGCGEGLTSAYALDTRKCGFAFGIELCDAPGAKAASRLDQVLIGDVELLLQDDRVREVVASEGSFDVAIMSEVLEHLRDPWTMLRRLRPLLSPGATLVAGSPNVAHHSVVRMLLNGRWDLTDNGIMDRTHLRWFTPESFAAMFEEAGYEVLSVAPADPLRRKARVVNQLTGGRLRHLLHPQIVLNATPQT